MKRREAIDVLAKARRDALSVATMRNCVPWHEVGQAEGDHLDALGCMGSAGALGLGLALARPERRVIVLDGDGSLLMQLGTLVTVVGSGATNLYHFVFANGVHETSGGQDVPARDVFDWCALARAAGYPAVWQADDLTSLREGIDTFLTTPGPGFAALAIDRDAEDIGWPKLDRGAQSNRLRTALAGSAGEPATQHPGESA